MHRKGFTLIEIMIVVAIIGLLSMVAIPNYVRYQLRSKTAEARMNLGGIRVSETAFVSSFDNYASPAAQPSSIPGQTKATWPSNVCPAGCNRTNTGACTQFSCIGYKPAGRVYYQYGGAARPASPTQTAEFAAGAVGDLDGDANNGSFSFQSNSNANATVGVVADGVSSCAAGRNANQVVECAYGRY